MVEVIDILWTGGGYELSRRPFRPTNNAIPFWGAETICGEKTAALTFKTGATECSLSQHYLAVGIYKSNSTI